MYDSLELTENIQQQQHFQTHFPAVDLSNKQYSLQADIVTGWKPKTKIMGPIPLNCDSALVDEIIDELTSFGSKYKERVIYLGCRFTSSFKMHQQLQRRYQFKYESSLSSSYPHMNAFFRKFYANFKSKNTRIFKGINPTIKIGTQLIFQSNFESGNLDAVIKVGEDEYDLFLRIDTNTRGHLQWFNFTVKNCGKKKVKFNIVNLKKAKTLYQRGMKPYVYSEYLRQTKELNWFQGGQNVKYSKRKLTYEFINQLYQPEYITFSCLEFNYTFQVDWEEVQFAYSPPFTYSDMNQMIVKLKRQAIQRIREDQESIVSQQVLCESLGGLQVPLLTITNPQVDNKRKKCILVSGRIHPGQPCGSFMGKGLLEYICSDSQQARELRKNIVFKVIPMINPDGVTAGNFRTSLCGRDLNRTFQMNNDFLIPEVKALKELVVKLKNQYKNRLIFFFDLHGHSVKKNVFLYGPQYQIWETNYYKTRIFPKILSNKTDLFRYYSCLFRVSQFKRSTARAAVLKNVPHCYTIQASTGFYYCPTEKKDIPFTPQKWTYMGRMIGESIKDYMDMLNDQNVFKEQRKQKLITMKTMKNNRLTMKKNSEKISSNKFQTRIVSSSQKSKINEETFQKKPEVESNLSKKARDLIQSIKQDQKKYLQEKNNDGHESDSFSQGGSDSESAGDDIPEEELKVFQDSIFTYMQQYRQKFYHQKQQKQFSLKQTKKKLRDIEQRKIKKQPKVQMIPSLRKKNQHIGKLRQALIFTKLKEEFKQAHMRHSEEVTHTKITFNKLEGISPQSFKHKNRRVGIQSELLQKRETIGSLLFGLNRQ